MSHVRIMQSSDAQLVQFWSGHSHWSDVALQKGTMPSVRAMANERREQTLYQGMMPGREGRYQKLAIIAPSQVETAQN
jgi:hypothetical protein